jgi:N-acetylneuraminic acid mutarotase
VSFGHAIVSRPLALALTPFVCLLLVACGGGGGSGPTVTPPPMTYTVGVTVSGLVDNGLVLQLNGADDLTITANGPATFSTALTSGAKYAVTVSAQPNGQTCTAANGAGTVGSANVTNIVLTCSSPGAYNLSANVTGLTTGSTLVLLVNGGAAWTITANGVATFSTQFSSGEAYSVMVQTQPVSPPTQTCTVGDASGTIGITNVTVAVACVTPSSVTVTVAGLSGSGLTLLLNGTDPLSVAVSGTAAFSAQFTTGTNYTVTIQTQPTGPSQTCTISNGSGTVGSANATSVDVICPLIYAAAPTGDWTWMGPAGLLQLSQSGIYGTEGIPSPLNYPGLRSGANSWTDQGGNLWLFGGQGYITSGTAPPLTVPTTLNDLWKYSPSTGAWEWVNGLTTAVFRTQGTPSTKNVPHATDGASSWIDHAGNLWLFGGDGYNDLWKYEPSAGTWEWVSGSDEPGAAGVYGNKGTPAPGNVPGARSAATSWIDAAGNLWLFGGVGTDTQGHPDETNDLWKYNPATGLWTWISGSIAGNGTGPSGVYGTQGMASASNTPGGRDSAVSWIDAAGNLWLFGGSGIDSTGTQGELNDLWKYSPSAGTWTWVGGANVVNSLGVYGTLGVPSAGSLPPARSAAVSWIDPAGNFWLFGGSGYTAPALDAVFALNDFWKYSPTDGTWTWVGGSMGVNDSSDIFGTAGVPIPGNVPGARGGAVSWIDPTGNMWLFGGSVWDGFTTSWLADFWVFTPAAPIN